ncbi:folylpolyglutamate synthetase [Capsaspora owczarzaki ATCC 30864]|uniref:folylpolyglutamate synthetase n=1 Tax=Capsaspora owczarzaki (strain ATCC 30864) TaxID=595528 RepID=UPI0003522D00|nr:folylpolyglutamate synthetase [Capsaspora owczarzaki ATCC 30864]|eukprot:XP_004348304.2 folylpolyglutamate synthetase [Capsaspora owczarzaki ATCC 30864]
MLSQRIRIAAPICRLARAMSSSSPTGRGYNDAVKALNSLASNATLLSQLRNSSYMNQVSIPEMHQLLERIGVKATDLNSLNVVHVTGTKGKGSTCAFVDSILREHGVQTLLYTSPHLVRVQERIRLHGKPVGSDLFAKYFWAVWSKLEATKNSTNLIGASMPSYFRYLTLMTFLMALETKVDALILEVGIGGSYDATNVVPAPTVCGITTMGYDHVNVLGNTLTSITTHKAGIIKHGVPIVSAKQESDEATMVIRDTAQRMNAPLTIARPLSQAFSNGLQATLGLNGDHQQMNAAVAAQIAQIWLGKHRPEAALKEGVLSRPFLDGLAKCRWPGRNQTAIHSSNSNIRLWLDGAHNIESLTACASWISSKIASGAANRERRYLMFNCSHDRDVKTLLKPLVQAHLRHPFDGVVFSPNIVKKSSAYHDIDTSNNQPDDFDAQAWIDANAGIWRQLVQELGGQSTTTNGFLTIDDALEWLAAEQVRQSADQKKPVQFEFFATGSLHLVGGVLRALEIPID